LIPYKPSPKLKNESEWSPEFVDFIAKCLTKNPAQRPSADELLQVRELVLSHRKDCES